MRNWRLFSLALVALLAAVVWRALPTPTAQAQGMKLPPGVSLKVTKFDTMGMPGVKTLTWNRLEIKPGAKLPNADMGPKTWDFCYQLTGTMTVTTGGKTSDVTPGSAYTIPENTKIPLATNKGKVTSVDIYWEMETQ
jgi:mannose-6-phosphate isomerase-like protein (cupin superfamily)